MQTFNRVRGLATVATRAALAAALACGMGTGFALTAPTALAKEAAAKPESNSPEFAKAAGPLQKVISDMQPLIRKYAAAPADGKAAAMADVKAALVAGHGVELLQAAEAGVKNATDRRLVGQWGQMVAQVMGDMKLFQHALQNVIDAGSANPAEQLNNQYKLGTIAYQNGDYAAAIKALTPVVAANFPEDNAAEILCVSYVESNQTDQAFAALRTAVDARHAAGGAVPMAWFKRANNIAYHGKMVTPGNEWALRMAADNAAPDRLLAAVQLLRFYNGYDTPETLDLARLLMRSGALVANGTGVHDEYEEYLHSADVRRYPDEVLKLIQAGTAIGALDAKSQNVAELQAMASKIVAADRASLPAFVKDAQAPNATVKTTSGAADALLSYGDSAKAVTLYQLALSKPGADTNVLLSRMGIAQVDAGDYAGAQASFARVTGARKPLADLWAIYAAAKAKAGSK